MTNEELLEQLVKVIDAKLDEKLEPMKKDMATKADIHTIAEDMAGFFHKTWEKMDETNERVTVIEDHLDMPHPKEN
jgi:hypothetical protein